MSPARTERLLAWAIGSLIALNALWVLWIPAFPTLDGWTHLHTARMLFEGAPEGVYCENPGLVPNRVGHIILGVLQTVLPGLIAERALLALIILGTGLGTWSLARSLGQVSPIVLLALPFTVNFMLVLGFHNFLLGVALAFGSAAWWMRAPRISWITFLILLGASVMLFYTHTTALALFFLLLGGHELLVVFSKKDRTSALPGGRWGSLLAVFVACLPALVLFLDFNAAQQASWGEVDRAANLRDLFDLRSLVLYHYGAEEKFTYAIKLLLVASALLSVFVRWQNSGLRMVPGDLALVLAVLLLVLYFILPDSSGYASYITVRLQWMALLLFIVWVAVQRIPLVAAIPIVAMTLLAHQARNGYISQAMAPMADRIQQVSSIATSIPEGSVVLPINREDNWLLGHIPSLLAIERNVVFLDNYECGTGYFPYVWCSALPEQLGRHLGGGAGCLEWLPDHILQQRTPRIDRIVLIGHAGQPDHCRMSTLQDVLVRHYRKGATNPYATVYELVR